VVAALHNGAQVPTRILSPQKHRRASLRGAGRRSGRLPDLRGRAGSFARLPYHPDKVLPWTRAPTPEDNHHRKTPARRANQHRPQHVVRVRLWGAGTPRWHLYPRGFPRRTDSPRAPSLTRCKALDRDGRARAARRERIRGKKESVESEIGVRGRQKTSPRKSPGAVPF
jgi:hypothetical protein